VLYNSSGLSESLN